MQNKTLDDKSCRVKIFYNYLEGCVRVILTLIIKKLAYCDYLDWSLIKLRESNLKNNINIKN